LPATPATESENTMEAEAKPEATAPCIVPTGCCPPFDPAAWKDDTIVWHDKPFVTDHVHCFLHVPLDMRQRVMKNQRWIESAQAQPEHPLMLSTDTSPWGADLFIEVTRPVPGARMTALSGTFATKVYEGPYHQSGKWVTDMRRRMAEQGQPVQKIYFGYTTCPRCAKAYGKNYVILFAEHAVVDTSANAA
jgi:hypothetical protein